ncbi:carbohydrate ABC transporter permease [Bacillota bacterium Meth-B3]|nr:sugar ABC transporter permease [Christensenellaceae bacterium]MEA5064602.1 sugar ABC transporter permease [Eubacteriales bacterium]MEA5069393.1 sugar ABC transporter permease [Christensenellaceae bacterium]
MKSAPAAQQGIKPRGFWASITPYLYILPAMVIMTLFVFIPFGNTINLSTAVTDANGAVVERVGLQNYVDAFKSPDFQQILGVTFQFALATVLGSILIGLITGIIANEQFVGRGFFRTVYAMPLAVSSAAISVVFLFIMHPTFGILNYLLQADIKWLRSVKYALGSVSFVTVWMNTGLNFIFVIAALQSVDNSLYEAASIEGAGFFRKHWNVTLPCISPTLFFLLIVNIINSFQAYAQINLLTQGGPGKFTTNIVYNIYLEAFRYSRFYMAATQSVILFILIFLLTLIQFKLEKKVTY